MMNCETARNVTVSIAKKKKSVFEFSYVTRTITMIATMIVPPTAAAALAMIIVSELAPTLADGKKLMSEQRQRSLTSCFYKSVLGWWIHRDCESRTERLAQSLV
jgi:hypothetical protein